MNRIDARFKALRKARRKAFIAYIAAGDPALAVTKDLVIALEKAGVDILELGIPFSDPVADGPTIQAASQRALKHGVTLRAILRMTKALRKKTRIPIVYMTYYNPLLAFGLEKFFKASREAGVDGIIVPDLPYEEAGELVKYARRYEVATIFLAAPTSIPGRVQGIAELSRGFIYYVSLTGVTGVRRELPRDIVPNIRYLRSKTDKPVAVGFGVSTPAQAREIARLADGVIVGSALINVIARHLGDRKALITAVTRFASGIAKAVHGGRKS